MVLVNEMVLPAQTLLGVNVKLATGLSFTFTVKQLVNTLPEGSVAVSVNVYAPNCCHTTLTDDEVVFGIMLTVEGPVAVHK